MSNTKNNKCNGLSETVKESLEKYFEDMDGHDPCNLYELIITQVEKPLFETVMQNTGGNVSQAALLLGLNRGTLSNRLKKYGLDQ